MTAVYTLLSCVRQWRFQTGGFDLGIHDQVIWEYSRFLHPTSTLMGFDNALGDHFDPILMLLGPLYWFLPGPEALFLAQSLAVAIGGLAVFRFARRRLGRTPAYQWTAAYLVFWGIQSGLSYDFHDLLLAVPFIAFAIDFIDLKRWGWAFFCLVMLLFVKEDLGLLVAFFGVYLLVLGEWKKGSAIFFVGVVGFLLEMTVVLPYLASPRSYNHWVYPDLGRSLGESIGTILRHPLLVPKVLFSDPQKIVTMFCSFLACGFLTFLSPVGLLTIPLLAERMLSNAGNLYSMGYHYSATIAPVLMMGGVDGLYRLAMREKGRSGKLVPIASLVVLVLNLATVPIFPLRDLFRAKFYRSNPVVETAPKALALVPPDAKVLAQDTIVPHLSHRKSIYMMAKSELGMDCDYFIACRDLPAWPFDGFDPIEGSARQRMSHGYQKIFDENGWIVLKKAGGQDP